MLRACAAVIAYERSLLPDPRLQHFRSNNPARIIMKTIFAIALTTLILTGCNTIAGIGKDVQKVGQVVEGAGRK
jgi:entericidin A